MRISVKASVENPRSVDYSVAYILGWIATCHSETLPALCLAPAFHTYGIVSPGMTNVVSHIAFLVFIDPGVHDKGQAYQRQLIAEDVGVLVSGQIVWTDFPAAIKNEHVIIAVCVVSSFRRGLMRFGLKVKQRPSAVH